MPAPCIIPLCTHPPFPHTHTTPPPPPPHTHTHTEQRAHVTNFVSRATVSKFGGEHLPCFLGPPDPASGLHDVYYDSPIPMWYKDDEPPKTPINDCNYAYVCGKGARVAVRVSARSGGSTLRCGTVVGLVADTSSVYTIRFDNSSETTSMNLCISNAIPESTYQYDRGQQLMLLVPPHFSVWEDVVVVSHQGKECGSLHVVSTEGGREMEVDLNRFNHTIQSLSSTTHFFNLRDSFRQNLRKTGRRVVDFITGRKVDVGRQCFNFEVVQHAPGTQAGTPNRSISIEALAKELAHVPWNRSLGEFSAHPMLIIGGAGAGKTWASHKVVWWFGVFGLLANRFLW